MDDRNQELNDTQITQESGGKTDDYRYRLLIAAVVVMAVVIVGLIVALIWSHSGGNSENGADRVTGAAVTPTDKAPTPTTETPEKTPTQAAKTTVTPTPEPTKAVTPTITPTPTVKPENVAGLLVEYAAGNNTWNDGGVTMRGLEFGIRNNTKAPIQGGWKLELTIEGLDRAGGWNGTYTVKGNVLTITSAGYNGDIAVNATVYTGCNLGTKQEKLVITKALLNGAECTVRAGYVDQNQQNNQGKGNGGKDVVKTEELLQRPKDHVQGDDWLHTDGRRILDKDGREVWLTGVNWFGYNTGTNTFDGLWNSKMETTV